MPIPDAELVTTAEAAKLLKTNVRSIIRKVERDELKPERKLPGIRGAYIFRVEDIHALGEAELSQEAAS
ncbi:helix-turn-helix domain-containing protein [Arthrobacter sp. Hz1]